MPRYVDRLRHAKDRLLEDRWFDLSRSTDTRTGGGDGNGNMPAFTRDVRYWHTYLRERLVDWRGCSFVDAGCGKGKALLVWGEENEKAGMRQAMLGLESDPELVATARLNLVAARSLGMVYRGDAAHFDYPLFGSRLIVWFFNSFGQDLMEPMLDSLERTECWFVYGNPQHAEWMMRERGWEPVTLRVGVHERSTFMLLRSPHAGR